MRERQKSLGRPSRIALPISVTVGSEVADTVEHLLQETSEVLRGDGPVEHHGPVVDEVADEHAGDAERQLEPGRDLDERHGRQRR